MMKLKCCICKKNFSGYGHNPTPIKDRGLCCDKCNKYVIRERLLLYGITEGYVLDVLMEVYEENKGYAENLKKSRQTKTN